MKKNYHMSTASNPVLVAYLEQQGISYNDSYQLLSFDVCDNTSKGREVIDYILHHFKVLPIITCQYTRKEMAAARLITIQPKSHTIEVNNEDEAYRYLCPYKNMLGDERYRHKEQIGTFTIRKEPPSGRQTAFWTEDTGIGTIFTDSRVREMALNNHLTGIQFRDVFLKNGKCSNHIFQLCTDNVLGKMCLEMGHGEKILNCPQCGKEKLLIGHDYQLHMKFFGMDLQYDLYKTEWLFGEGFAASVYLISQRFYQLLLANKLAYNVIFEPIAEIK